MTSHAILAANSTAQSGVVMKCEATLAGMPAGSGKPISAMGPRSDLAPGGTWDPRYKHSRGFK